MIDFTNLTKKRRPSLPWEKAKNMILNKSYNLSVVFSDDSLMKKLNKQYRNKNKPANVLSFPLSKKEGEIFINLSSPRQNTPAKKIAREKDSERVLHLFIHSLLHLKGFSHSDKMESEEEKFLNKFK